MKFTFDKRLAELRAQMQSDPDPTLMHLFPGYDGKEHITEGFHCWCGPKADDIEPRLVIHNSAN